MPTKTTAEPMAVVELFTSQGCSSCPTADALLGKLAGRDDVIALSMPVDYWDYLGWKDTLANPKFSERQRAYAHARGDGTDLYAAGGGERPGPRQRCRRGHDRGSIEKTGKRLLPRFVPIRLSETKEQRLVVETGPAQPGVRPRKPRCGWR